MFSSCPSQKTPGFHTIDLSYFNIVHQCQIAMHVAWQIFIWALKTERATFSQLQRKRRWWKERHQKERRCAYVCACVGGGGTKMQREPRKRYGDCLTLSASLSMVSVTAAWWWQACREAGGPCVAHRVTLLSACQYFCTWHTVLSYYHDCSIGMSLNASVAPVAQDNFTGHIWASFIS